jgi:hypothetical protein
LESVIVNGPSSKSGNRLNNLKMAKKNVTAIVLLICLNTPINNYRGKDA